MNGIVGDASGGSRGSMPLRVAIHTANANLATTRESKRADMLPPGVSRMVIVAFDAMASRH